MVVNKNPRERRCDPIYFTGVLVKFARGSMFGEPGNVKRQRRIILDALNALQTMTEPGTIQELPYRWKWPDPV